MSDLVIQFQSIKTGIWHRNPSDIDEEDIADIKVYGRSLYTKRQVVDEIMACEDLAIVCKDYGHHDYNERINAGEVMAILTGEKL